MSTFIVIVKLNVFLSANPNVRLISEIHVTLKTDVMMLKDWLCISLEIFYNIYCNFDQINALLVNKFLYNSLFIHQLPWKMLCLVWDSLWHIVTYTYCVLYYKISQKREICKLVICWNVSQNLNKFSFLTAPIIYAIFVFHLLTKHPTPSINPHLIAVVNTVVCNCVSDWCILHTVVSALPSLY